MSEDRTLLVRLREASAGLLTLARREEMRTSYSKLNTFRQCGLKYYYQEVEPRRRGRSRPRIQRPAPNLSFDKSLHLTLEAFHRRELREGSTPPFSVLETLYERHWIRKDYDLVDGRPRADLRELGRGPEEADYYARGLEALRQYYQRWVATGWFPYATSLYQRWQMGHIVVVARIDLVARDREGRVHLIDFKSSKRAIEPSAMSFDLAAAIAFLAARANPRIGADVETFSYDYLLLERRVTGTFGFEDLTAAQTEIRRLVRLIERRRFEPVQGVLCNYCDYRLSCAAWKGAPPPDDNVIKDASLQTTGEERIRLSYSKMSLFDRCPRAYKRVYLDGIPPSPQPFFSFGRCVHAAFEDFYDYHGLRRRPTLAHLLRLFDEHWQLSRDGYRSPAEEQRYYDKGVAMLTKYYKRYVEGKPFRNAAYIEAYFELPIGRRGLMIGYIDRIDRLPDGSYEVLDYKTEPTLRTQEQVDKDKQLTTYYWACIEGLGFEPKKLSLYMLDHDVKLSTRRTPRDIDALVAFVDGVIERMEREQVYPPKINKYCRSCDYLHDCPLREEVLARRDIRSMEFD